MTGTFDLFYHRVYAVRVEKCYKNASTSQTINEVLREKRAISPVMALRLAQLFGNTPEFWLNAQRAYDLWQTKQDHQAEIEKIKPLRAA